MNEISVVKGALDRIGSIENVLETSLVTRGGGFVMGQVPAEVQRETFSAMCAIVQVASETIVVEMNEGVGHTRVVMGGRELILMPVGPNYVLAVMATPQVDETLLYQEARSLREEIRNML